MPASEEATRCLGMGLGVEGLGLFRGLHRDYVGVIQGFHGNYVCQC